MEKSQKWIVCGYCKGEAVPEEDKDTCACPTCDGEGGYYEVSPQATPLGDVSTEDLKKELENRGYFVHNMWCIDDVEAQINSINEDNPDDKQITIEDVDWVSVLNSALTNESIVEQINETIYNEISE